MDHGFRAEHFELLMSLDGVLRTPGDAAQDHAYAALVGAYEATADWARAINERLFPNGWIRKLSKPTNQGQKFKHYTWTRIYPRENAPTGLAYMVGIDASGEFCVKLDTVQLTGTPARRRYDELRQHDNYRSPFAESLPAEIGLGMSFEELVDWSIDSIAKFDSDYDALAAELGLAAPTQNADWSWDEHVLALDLYLSNPVSPPNKQSTQVLALSTLLGRMGAASGVAMTEKFRNANGVYMKMMNFRRFDPDFQVQGKTGLGRGSKGEEAVWRRYAGDRVGLRQVVEGIKARYPVTPGWGPPDGPTDPVPNFATAFRRFQELVAANQKDLPFTSFAEGIVAAHEDYKPRLRRRALEHLKIEDWREETIGSGQLLDRVIAAIEIDEKRLNLINNLVFWQNRFGHANRDHRALLEAREYPKRREPLERALLALFRGTDDGAAFAALSELTGAKYPLLAYLFYLKDSASYLPIQPTGFDQAFSALGIDLMTLRNCDWENYQRYNSAIGAVRAKLAQTEGLSDVELIDAHSFCWLLVKLPSSEDAIKRAVDPGRIAGARAKALVNMRLSIENTVRNSNGQQVTRTVKNKESFLDTRSLDKLLERLMRIQSDRCALTGIPFEFDGRDPNLLPSADRIDSAGQYAEDNLQIVCRFINFWKCDADNGEFKRLLELVRQDTGMGG